MYIIKIERRRRKNWMRDGMSVIKNETIEYKPLRNIKMKRTRPVCIRRGIYCLHAYSTLFFQFTFSIINNGCGTITNRMICVMEMKEVKYTLLCFMIWFLGSSSVVITIFYMHIDFLFAVRKKNWEEVKQEYRRLNSNLSEC